MTGSGAEFGCGACYGADATSAWEHFLGGMDSDPPIVDDPHFSAAIVRCRNCAQAFLRIFTEITDWSGGDNPQYITIVPVTGAEAAALADGAIPVLRAGKLGAGRRHLISDWPSEQERRLMWSSGEFLVSEGG
jgi:hypothetical protein